MKKTDQYIGDIILESLADTSKIDFIQEFCIHERTSERPSEEVKLWHIRRYRLPYDIVLQLVPILENNFVDGAWYIQFYSTEKNELYVMLKGRHFLLPKYRDASWDEMITYGEKIGVGRRWTENIPVDFPGV